MFDYTICNHADKLLFRKQCRALERGIPDLKTEKLLEDVNGTLIQRYSHAKGRILVKNDEQVDSLYVISDFDLAPFFKKD